MTEFKDRLHPIKVEHRTFESSTGKNPQPKIQGPEKAEASEKIDPNQWLKIMDAFADGIQSLKAQPPGCNGNFEDNNYDKGLKDDVRVALIDDGVDFMDRSLLSSLLDGKCFPDGLNEHEVIGAPDPPFHGSTTGHGTFMASMIRRICPAVKIFVCKIDMIQGQKANFTAKSAADVSLTCYCSLFNTILIHIRPLSTLSNWDTISYQCLGASSKTVSLRSISTASRTP